MNETIRRAICRSGGTRGGVFPYRKQKTPQFDDRIRRQRVAYANYSPIGLAARDGGFDEEKEGWIFSWLTKEDRDTEGVPSAGSSKFSIKVYCHRDPDNRLTLSHKHLLQSHGMSVQFIYIVRGSERKDRALQ